MSEITYGHSHLSLGVIIGGPAFILTVAGFVLLGVWLLRHDWDSFDRGMARFFGFASLGVAALIAILAGVGFYPYSGEYHHWQNISGTVSSTNSRFLSDGHGTSQKFVVTLDGSPQQFGCNDTRCATVHKGDSLTITCKRTWQWFGTPGYDCNFVSLRVSS
jgi:hypothetical protein